MEINNRKNIASAGFATLTFAMLLMFIMSLVTFMSAKTSLVEQKINGNTARSLSTFNAADGGIDQALAYLNANRTTIITDSNNDGFIDSYTNAAITNVANSNGSRYSITYANPTVSSFNTIQITSAGASDDATASRTVRQLVAFQPFMNAKPAAALTTKLSANLSGNTEIINTYITNTDAATGTTIWAGDTVAFSGSASTTSVNGTGSDRSNIGSDVTMNSTTLSSMSNDQYFQYFLSHSRSETQAAATMTLTGANNYSATLNGATKQLIWMDTQGGEAQINSNVTIGSPTAPVILIVNGDIRINGTCTVYGMVYVTGRLNAVGTMDVHGAVIDESDSDGNGTPYITYDPTVLSNLQSTIGTYVKVPGGWRDF